MPAAAPAKLPVEGVVFNTQSRAEFDANWDRQVGCPGAVRPGGARVGVERDARLRSGGGVVGTRRAARAADHDVGLGYGHGREADDADADRAGHPRQAGDSRSAPRTSTRTSARPRRCWWISGCASHNAMWEKAAHTLLFNASLEWLDKGTVNGAKTGVLKLGY